MLEIVANVGQGFVGDAGQQTTSIYLEYLPTKHILETRMDPKRYPIRRRFQDLIQSLTLTYTHART